MPQLTKDQVERRIGDLDGLGSMFARVVVSDVLWDHSRPWSPHIDTTALQKDAERALSALSTVFDLWSRIEYRERLRALLIEFLRKENP